jgi:hypothetical protein
VGVLSGALRVEAEAEEEVEEEEEEAVVEVESSLSSVAVLSSRNFFLVSLYLF